MSIEQAILPRIVVRGRFYIRTQQGWLYLAIVLDLYARRVVSWAFSSQPNSELSVRAINLAVQLRQPQQPVLLHTNQGVQYSSDTLLSQITQQSSPFYPVNVKIRLPLSH